MLTYLHVQTISLINDIASWVLQFWNYRILPYQYVPDIVATLEHEVAEISL